MSLNSSAPTATWNTAPYYRDCANVIIFKSCYAYEKKLKEERSSYVFIVFLTVTLLVEWLGYLHLFLWTWVNSRYHFLTWIQHRSHPSPLCCTRKLLYFSFSVWWVCAIFAEECALCLEPRSLRRSLRLHEFTGWVLSGTGGDIQRKGRDSRRLASAGALCLCTGAPPPLDFGSVSS